MFNVCRYVCVLTALVSPNVQLLGKLRYHQESPPALTLLGLQNVSKNVVTDVDDVLSFDAQQIAHNVRRTCKNKHIRLSQLSTVILNNAMTDSGVGLDVRKRRIWSDNKIQNPTLSQMLRRNKTARRKHFLYLQSKRFHAAEVQCRSQFSTDPWPERGAR